MTQEEKAKAYDEAIERAKHALTTDMDNSGHWAVNFIFPELKESEDDKIRSFLIDFIKVCGWTDKKDQGWPLREDVLVWLEKQGEQKPKNPVDNVEQKQECGEEEELYINDAIVACKSLYGEYSETAQWLKSLNRRMQGMED